MALALTPAQWLKRICPIGETCKTPNCETLIRQYHQFQGASPDQDFKDRLKASKTLHEWELKVSDVPNDVKSADCSTHSISFDAQLKLVVVPQSNRGKPAYYHTALFTSLLKTANSFHFYHIEEKTRQNVIFSVQLSSTTEYYDLSGQFPPNAEEEKFHSSLTPAMLIENDPAYKLAEVDNIVAISLADVLRICAADEGCDSPNCELAIARYHRKTTTEFTTLLKGGVISARVYTYNELNGKINPTTGTMPDCMTWTVQLGANLSFNVIQKPAGPNPPDLPRVPYYEIALFRGLLKQPYSHFVFYTVVNGMSWDIIFSVHGTAGTTNLIDYFDLSGTIPPPGA